MLKKIRRFLLLVIVLLVAWWGYRTNQNIQVVLTYRGMVRDVLAENDTDANEDLVLAMIYTETKGQTNDVMQSSESSSGYINSITDSRESVRQGVSVLSDNIEVAKSSQVDVWTAVQAYNFGANYIDYVAKHGGKNTIEIAKAYSRDVVAPSLGNTTGETYKYHNVIAYLNGGSDLYKDGGNYYYSRQVQMNMYLIKFFSLFS